MPDDLAVYYTSIKSSLSERMDHSKTFILVVGAKTKDLRAGSCVYCKNYDWNKHGCGNGRSTSFKSFIDYECDKAIRDNLKIVVLYNSGYVLKSRCPEQIREKGVHLASYHWENYTKKWNPKLETQ